MLAVMRFCLDIGVSDETLILLFMSVEVAFSPLW